MPRTNRILRKNGYSLVAWSIVFAVVLAAVLFIRAPFKRALQGKINTTADYMFWTKWGQVPQQYKGETTSFVKTKTQQDVSMKQLEKKDKSVTSQTDSAVTENTASSGVEEGSQPVLKTFDLNNVLP